MGVVNPAAALSYESPVITGAAQFGTMSGYLQSTDSWGFGTTSPTHQLHAVIRDNDNILIDCRTSPRQYTFGVLRFEHTAAIPGTRPITFDIDANGFNTHCQVVDFKATGISSGENHILDMHMDTSNSTGGEIQVLAVNKIGSGNASVTAVEVYPGVIPLLQKTGSPISLTQAWKYTVTTFSDVTAAFSSGTNVEIFTNDNDYIYCGSDTIFNQLEVLLTVKASNTISATFEYSTGEGTWSIFSPSDGTNGFTTDGNIMWSGSLAGWTSATVNTVSKFYVRIRRTRNSLVTKPSEATITVTSTINYSWDENGDIHIRKGKISGLIVYADRAAALAGGLTTGQLYQTSTGVLMVA